MPRQYNISSSLDEELEDLESMRRRIRDDARRRRQVELQRRAEKRISQEVSRRRRRRRSSSSASSCSSCDLLASSPSPSPSPSSSLPSSLLRSFVTDDVMATTSSGASSNVSFGTASLDQRKKSSSEKTRQGENASATTNGNKNGFPPKNMSLGKSNSYSNSDSSEDDDDLVADMSKRLAEKQQRESQSLKIQAMNASGNNSAVKALRKNTSLWSSDDSEEEMDVRQLIARQVAEKRKRESTKSSTGSEAMASSSKRNISGNTISSIRAINKHVVIDECTPNMCSKRKPGGVPSSTSSSVPNISLDASKQIDKSIIHWSGQTPFISYNKTHQNESARNNVNFALSKKQRPLYPSLQKVENTTSPCASSSGEGVKKSDGLGAAAKALAQPSTDCPKQINGQVFRKSAPASDDDSDHPQIDGRLDDRKPAATIKAMEQPTVLSAAITSNQKYRHDALSKARYDTTNPTLLQPNAKKSSTASSAATAGSSPDNNINNIDPIVGKEVRPKPNIEWSVLKQCLLVRTVGMGSPKRKIAGFDLDQTLVIWRCAGWPSQPEHYELWSAYVVDKLRQLHDDEGYKLVIFSNQGGIKNAFHGKKSSTVKGIIDWIAKVVNRPLYAVCSTKKNGGYHKGNPGMWEIMEEYCNCGKEVCPDSSFFVGDADGTGDGSDDVQRQRHQRSGTDKLFAVNVGQMRNTSMKFYTPTEYFGLSNVERRRAVMPTLAEAPPAPMHREAILARAALLGGYLNGPILLLMIGVQGSGKSSFCQSLIDNKNNSKTGGPIAWCHFGQDTIKNGRPGTRQAVDKAAREALCNKKNVVIDRMHLDAEQRSYFLELGKQCQVPVHGLVMMASKDEVEDRVMHRVNHPGGVEGVTGARIAMASLSKLTLPKYDEEGFVLISYSYEIDGKLTDAYRRVGSNGISDNEVTNVPKTIKFHNTEKVELPMITLGTMNIRKEETASTIFRAIDIGMESIDTAPTYKNEGEIGTALMGNTGIKVTIKVPKRVTSPEQARKEVKQSMSLLQCSQVDIILIHWPCDLIVADTLSSVWKELEAMKKEGLCASIGVCNFSIMALKLLLPRCAIKPAINQVERHPLLPQYDLVEYCNSQGIIVQAHSPLGNGSELLLGNDIIVRAAQESEMSPAQILLCWNLQQNFPVVIKFSSEEHGNEVASLLRQKLTLSPQQMNAIDSISLYDETHRFVAPPFMYRRGAVYSWGDTPPKSW